MILQKNPVTVAIETIDHDGRRYHCEVDIIFKDIAVRDMIKKATRNRTEKCKRGPVTVKIMSRTEII